MAFQKQCRAKQGSKQSVITKMITTVRDNMELAGYPLDGDVIVLSIKRIATDA